ncbi:MAG TPA: MFS transporter [Anaerolineae bacterium]
MTLPTASRLDEVYDFIIREEEGRTCAAIPDEACTDVPRNFILNGLNGSATKLAEQLASPGLVLPWLLATLGAPTALAGLLVPIRQAGALLPQLSVAGRIRRFPVRKWFWVGGGITQGSALALTVLAALTLPPLLAGYAIVGLLALFSVASGVGSVAFSDVMGKTIPRGRRGRLLAVRATAGGGLALLAGFTLRTYVADSNALAPYLILLGAAAALWFVAAFLFSLIKETPGATEGGRNGLQEALAGLALLRKVPGFRLFVLVRVLLLSIELIVPFYTLYAHRLLGTEAGNLATFVMASGLAAVLSSPFWGRFADRSSRLVMAWSGVIAVGAGGFALLFARLPAAWQTATVYALVYLLIGFAQAGVRVGRKTYLVDGAPADERPLYVALSNSLVGVVTLASGAFGLAAEAFGVSRVLITFSVLIGLGIVVSWRMPEAERMTGNSKQ